MLSYYPHNRRVDLPRRPYKMTAVTADPMSDVAASAADQQRAARIPRFATFKSVVPQPLTTRAPPQLPHNHRPAPRPPSAMLIRPSATEEVQPARIARHERLHNATRTVAESARLDEEETEKEFGITTFHKPTRPTALQEVRSRARLGRTISSSAEAIALHNDLTGTTVMDLEEDDQNKARAPASSEPGDKAATPAQPKATRAPPKLNRATPQPGWRSAPQLSVSRSGSAPRLTQPVWRHTGAAPTNLRPFSWVVGR